MRIAAAPAATRAAAVDRLAGLFAPSMLGADFVVTTVLAGSVVSDDAMLATHALLRSDIPPHGIAMGVPARTTRFKVREPQELLVDSRSFVRAPDRKANPEFPEPTPNQTRVAADGEGAGRRVVTGER